MIRSWKTVKKSGTYQRAVKNNRDAILKKAREISHELRARRRAVIHGSQSIAPSPEAPNQNMVIDNFVPECPNPAINAVSRSGRSEQEDEISPITSGVQDIDTTRTRTTDDEPSSEDECEMKRNILFQSHLREWAIQHQIKHTALKDLVKLINTDIGEMLPEDPITLLKTPQEVITTAIGNDGHYWHHGLEKCLKYVFQNISEPKTISLNINLDGLPIFNSSKTEFWPILFTITDMPEVPAMVIGIYCGTGKCSDIQSFLSPFVKEMKKAMTYGLLISSHKVTVQLRCFVCDSPARAYIKGVANFNAQQGCQKCTTVGEFSYVSNTNIFPRTVCEKRTDLQFRRKVYGVHHRYDSPLLELDIDMVEQFPAGDSLHLLHLGLTKRLLFGWRDGTFRLSNTKWASRTTNEVSEFLKQCKMPTEFHRVVRGLDCLAHWKGTEYRTFLHYVGIVALKDHLTNEAYEHFPLLFCAVTICTSKQYFHLLPTARAMLLQFIEIFAEIYGEHHVTSNVHNLSHLVDEVERFGELDSFSAYPFENGLGKIKRLLRNGHLPLPQVAKRIIEDFNCFMDSSRTSFVEPFQKTPILTKQNNGENVPDCLKSFNGMDCAFYSKVQLKEFSLGTDSANRWILTKECRIYCIINIIYSKTQPEVKFCCTEITEKANFFIIPIESRRLNIYCADLSSNLANKEKKIIYMADVKCKLVHSIYRHTQVFIPLLHTL